MKVKVGVKGVFSSEVDLKLYERITAGNLSAPGYNTVKEALIRKLESNEYNFDYFADIQVKLLENVWPMQGANAQNTNGSIFNILGEKKEIYWSVDYPMLTEAILQPIVLSDGHVLIAGYNSSKTISALRIIDPLSKQAREVIFTNTEVYGVTVGEPGKIFVLYGDKSSGNGTTTKFIKLNYNLEAVGTPSGVELTACGDNNCPGSCDFVRNRVIYSDKLGAYIFYTGDILYLVSKDGSKQYCVHMNFGRSPAILNVVVGENGEIYVVVVDENRRIESIPHVYIGKISKTNDSFEVEESNHISDNNYLASAYVNGLGLVVMEKIWRSEHARMMAYGNDLHLNTNFGEEGYAWLGKVNSHAMSIGSDGSIFVGKFYNKLAKISKSGELQWIIDLMKGSEPNTIGTDTHAISSIVSTGEGGAIVLTHYSAVETTGTSSSSGSGSGGGHSSPNPTGPIVTPTPQPVHGVPCGEGDNCGGGSSGSENNYTNLVGVNENGKEIWRINFGQVGPRLLSASADGVLFVVLNENGIDKLYCVG